MWVDSIAFPFRPTFRRLELEKRWWHRLCIVIFFVAVLSIATITALASYETWAPRASTMQGIDVVGFDDSPQPDFIPDKPTQTQPAAQSAPGNIDLSAGLIPKKNLTKRVEMPDGSFSFFATNTPDDAIRAQWNHAKTALTLKAILWTLLISLISTVVFSYVTQVGYRALLYVIFGGALQKP